MLKRSIWGLIDQVVNSLSSLLLAVMVARVSSPEEVGAWAVGYAIYTFLLTVSRNTISTTALISHNDKGHCSSQDDKGAASICLAFGLTAGILLSTVGLVIGGEVGSFAVIFAVGLPVLLVQDSVRYILIRGGMPQFTAMVDLVWLTVQVALGVWVSASGSSGQGVVLAWVFGAAVSGLLGLCFVGWVFSIRSAIQFVRTHLVTGTKLLLDSLLGAGTANILPVLLGAILGLAATGYFRGALTLLGVAGILVMGLTPIATVEVLGRATDKKFTNRFLLLWSLLLLGVGLLLFVVLRNLPEPVGLQLLGDTWYGTETILFAMSLQVMLRGPFTGVPIVLRSAHKLNSVIRLRLVNSLVTLGLIVTGAIFFGLNGAAWCWAIAALATSAISIGTYSRVMAHAADT